jgi:single-strand DNA-binding protein
MLTEAKFTVVGHIGSVEVDTKAKTPIAVISVGVDASYKTKDGKKVEKTNWCRIVTFEKNNINFISKYVTKGRYMRITGDINNNKREKDGKTIYSTDLIGHNYDFQDRKPD